MRMMRWLLGSVLLAALIAGPSLALAQNNALDFDGVDDEVDCGDPSGNEFDLVGDATIEAWVRVDTTPPSAFTPTAFTIVGKDEGPGMNVRKWFFGVQNGALAFHINGPGYGDGRWVYSDSFTQPFGTCYHAAVVKSGNSYAFFVDGAPVGGGSTDSVYDVAQSLTLGSSEPCCLFAGRIDEVRIWNVARTQSQIDASKSVALTGTEAGLVAYYDMNQSGDVDLIDRTPNGFDGIRLGLSGANAKPQFVDSCAPVPLGNAVPMTSGWGVALLVVGLAVLATTSLGRRRPAR